MQPKNNMNKITKDNAVEELMNNVPEFKSQSTLDKDDINLATVVFDHFGNFVMDRIKSQPLADPVIEKSFDFINRMMDSDIPEVQNLPVVGVFEVLAGSKQGIEVGKKLLNEKGREWLDKIKQHFDPQ